MLAKIELPVITLAHTVPNRRKLVTSREAVATVKAAKTKLTCLLVIAVRSPFRPPVSINSCQGTSKSNPEIPVQATIALLTG
jgi:hypothetical protein